MENSLTKQQKISAKKVEYAWLLGRHFSIFMLGLGSLVFMFQAGGYLAKQISDSPYMVFLFRFLFVSGYLIAIDWQLGNALSTASTTGKDNKPKTLTYWIGGLIIATLLTTVGLSIVSNLIISEYAAGKSGVSAYASNYERLITQDSLNKARAYETMDKAQEDQPAKIEAAMAQKKALVKEAINSTTSKRWKEDYYKYRNNAKAWFWTCTSCPAKYKAYRDGIKAAILEGDNLIALAKGYSDRIINEVSPTLSYQLQGDTTLSNLKQYIDNSETERLSRKKIINWILVILTVGCGVMSIITTFVLREHREEYGQQIHDDTVTPILYILEAFKFVFSLITNLLYTLIGYPIVWLGDEGWIKRFEMAFNVDIDGDGKIGRTDPATKVPVGTEDVVDKAITKQLFEELEHLKKIARNQPPPDQEDSGESRSDSKPETKTKPESQNLKAETEKPESLETKESQLESEYFQNLKVIPVSKLETDCRNHYRRSFQAARASTREDNKKKYLAEKNQLELYGYQVLEISKTSLEIIPPK